MESGKYIVDIVSEIFSHLVAVFLVYAFFKTIAIILDRIFLPRKVSPPAIGYVGTIDVEDLETKYRQVFQDKEILDVDELISSSVRLFQGVKFRGINSAEPGNDMVLFQYGTYEWNDGNGCHFEFTVARQVHYPEKNETRQLCITLLFNYELFTGIKKFNYGSYKFHLIDDFAEYIKSSPGYEAAKKAGKTKYIIQLIKVSVKPEVDAIPDEIVITGE